MSSEVCFHVPGSHVISETLDGEAVVINLESGVYYSLVGTAGEVWDALRDGATRSQLLAELARRYRAEPDALRAAVDRFLGEIEAEGLVVRRPAERGTTPLAAENGGAQTLFEAPRLERFTDIQDLLMLDPIHEVDDRGWPHQPAGD